MTYIPQDGVVPASGSEQAGGPPAGWYQAPQDGGLWRWWDGAQWTPHMSPGTPQPYPAHTTVGAPVQASTLAPPPRKRRVWLRVVATFGGIFAATFAIIALKGLLSGGFEEFTQGFVDGFNGGETRDLVASGGADWLTTSVLDGEGAISYDPEWEDGSAYVDLEALEEGMSDDAGLTVSIDGAWVIDTDDAGNSSILYVYSFRYPTGFTSPRIEVEAMMANPFEGATDLVSLSEGPVRTQSGLGAYTAEFRYDYYGETYVDSGAAAVQGRRAVLLYLSSGSEELGSGIDDVEKALNSLVIED